MLALENPLMARPSKLDKLDPTIREAIVRLRERGHTIDEIMAHLDTLGIGAEEKPSRSGLARQTQAIDAMLNTVRQSRAMAEALVQRVGEAAEGRQARANVELMQALVMQLLAATTSEGGEVSISAKEASLLAKTLADLTRAQRVDIDTTLKIKREMAIEAEKELAKLEAESKSRGETATPEQMIARIRALYAGEG